MHSDFSGVFNSKLPSRNVLSEVPKLLKIFGLFSFPLFGYGTRYTRVHAVCVLAIEES